MSTEFTQRFLAAKQALFHKLYGDLNEKQREAIFTVNGPLLILAGAGSGKTTVLVRRIAHIIRYGQAFDAGYMPESMTEADVASLETAAADDALTREEAAELLSPYACGTAAP